MKALVTGSAGFVGRHFVAELERRGYDVTGCDPLDGSDAHALFRSEDAVFDLVVHAAAKGAHRAAIDSQPATFPYNLGLDAAMFEWAIRTGQRRVLYLSSCAVYPRDAPGPWSEAVKSQPDDSYGWTKATGEHMAAAARQAGIPVTVVRPFSGYGEDQATNWPFGAFLQRVHRREDPMTFWGSGSQIRDWVHISDVVTAALAVTDAEHRGPVNLCTGVGTSMLDVLQEMCRQAGFRPTQWRSVGSAKHAGADYRVGDPTLMRAFHEPKVALADGIARALAS